MSAYSTEDLSRVEPDYLESYGLHEAPFNPRHQDKYFYTDAERAQALNLLQHLTHYSNLLLIVQGEQGVGKTAMLQRFVKNAESDWRICEVNANTMMDAEQLLFQAAQGFGVTQLPALNLLVAAIFDITGYDPVHKYTPEVGIPMMRRLVARL